MEGIQVKLKSPLITGVLGFVVGLFIGLVVLGWWLFPIEWKDAAARDLREDAKVDYLRMVIDSYILRKDALQAKMRWDELQPDAERLFAIIQNEENLSATEKKAIAKFSEIVQASPLKTEEESSSTDTTPPKKNQGITLMLIVFLVIALGGVAAAAVYFLRNYQRNTQVRRYAREDIYDDEEEESYSPQSHAYPTNEESGFSQKKESIRGAVKVEAAGSIKPTLRKEETPIAQFLTTYTLGDDLYDDSFSIDSPSGEFLGECGVGISQSIGVGEPKKVTAFELWLFDKNDIQTVTKVLMSQYAFNDADIKQALLAKGEPLLAQIGSEIYLETATLILLARVVDMAYGSGPLPPKSYFERITLDLQLFRKR